MKQIAILGLIIIMAAFALPPQKLFSAKTLEKSFGKISKNLYIGKTEITNDAYRRFLEDLLIKGEKEKYTHCLPDTSVWIYTGKNSNSFANVYFRQSDYDDYPLVGISYENALEYCKWLTVKYNSIKKRKFKKVLFRLPTRAEWQFAANGGDTTKQFTWGTGFMRNNRGEELCNYRDVGFVYDSTTKKYIENEIDLSSVPIRNKVTTKVESYFPSSFGMYNMCGNVAEMIAEKGIAKGGSYMDPAMMVTIASETKYHTPTADIGFRVAMEVLEK
jgi:formylglycine-generating enzyme required for sulfatase activity